MKNDLMRTRAYGSLHATRVDLIETHISWVFLLERDVFKVKKPVDFGFLDFRTIDQRKAACDAELRLNARLAPDVYIDVVPVRRDDEGRCTFGGSGPIVDWAVHMHRLSDARRGDTLLARGELTRDAIDAIAKRLARFHREAQTSAEISRFGAPETVRYNIDENFMQTRDVLERYVRRDEAEEIAFWQTAFVSDHAALFAERMRGGRIRDGHGDLRLEHVYLGDANDDVTIIDCIEFNERFRFADVCADVAFLSMDLAAHGRVDLAEQLIATYARETNDFELYALVDFYESYRAYVRGKLATFVAADEAMRSADRERATASARRHFLLALAANRSALLRPAVIAVGGIIAAGKTSIADRLGRAMSAPIVDADRTRKSMIGVEANAPIHSAAWTGAYDPSFSEDVYAEVLRRASIVLKSGRPVILDASFRSRHMRELARDLARAHGVPFRFVECRATDETCRARLVDRARSRGVSDGRLEIFDDFCKRYEPVVELSSSEHVVVDTTRSLDDSWHALSDRIATWPADLVE